MTAEQKQRNENHNVKQLVAPKPPFVILNEMVKMRTIAIMIMMLLMMVMMVKIVMIMKMTMMMMQVGGGVQYEYTENPPVPDFVGYLPQLHTLMTEIDVSRIDICLVTHIVY